VKRKNILIGCRITAVILSLVAIIGCSDDNPEPKFTLTLEANPREAGDVTGAGAYEGGTQVEISAHAGEDWEFVEWSGAIDYADDPSSAETRVTMPGYDIALAANFQEEAVYPIYGDGVTDIDGNAYITVIIRNMEWMAENLRVTRYINGDAIPTGLGNEDWAITTEGAYAVNDHNQPNADGINSPAEMVDAYGKLYNWYAIDDPRGLCPEGWHVASFIDWTELVAYLLTEYDFHNDWGSDDSEGVGNALKSCRQVDSPLGGDCETSVHPRWDAHSIHHGFNEFGFSALPGGYRNHSGSYYGIGISGFWWTSTEYSAEYAHDPGIRKDDGSASHNTYGNKRLGFSVRCVKSNHAMSDY